MIEPMSSLYVHLLDMFVAAALVAAVIVLWRRSMDAIVKTLVAQGIAVAAVAGVIGLSDYSPEKLVVAGAMFIVKAVLVPAALLRVVRSEIGSREAQPLVNVAASLLVAGGLTAISYGVTQPLLGDSPTAEMRVMPVGFAIALIGLFTMVSRRTALAQAVGFLLLDNGVAVVALVAASGVPLIVELGVLLDVLLAMLVVEVLVGRMQLKFGTTDLDLMRELHD